jgi:hypothetical protein
MFGKLREAWRLVTGDWGAPPNFGIAVPHNDVDKVDTVLAAGTPSFNGRQDPVASFGINVAPTGSRFVSSQWGAAFQVELDYEETPGTRIIEWMAKAHSLTNVETRPFLAKLDRGTGHLSWTFWFDTLNFVDRATDHIFANASGNQWTFQGKSGADYSLNVFAANTANLYLRGGPAHPFRIETNGSETEFKFGSSGTVFCRQYRASGAMGGSPAWTFGPANVNDAQFQFRPWDGGFTLVRIQAAGGQTGDLTAWHDSGGAARARVNHNGLPVFPSYALGLLPSASANNGAIVHVSDGGGTKGSTVGSGSGTLARSNGTNWIVL